MPKILSMVLAGGRVEELGILTLARPKAAVPFGGMYRIIDFAMSNLMHSGIDHVGVLAQYRPYSLIDHVNVGAPWDFLGRTRGVSTLSPHTGKEDSDWYKGTSDAIYQNLDYIQRYNPTIVLIASGDHIYKMDYRPMIKYHLEKKADLTIAFKPVPISEAGQYGVAQLDEDGQVVLYEEKPEKPRSHLASLTVYVFNRDILIERLKENARYGKTYQIYDEIIPLMVQENRVFGYIFEGYWAYARKIEAYYQANMDLIENPHQIDLLDWEVRTNLDIYNVRNAPPAFFSSSSRVSRSIISAGCIIEGEVENSILSPYVRVARGAKVKSSILMHYGVIEEGAELDEVILDKRATVGAGTKIGEGQDRTPNLRFPDLLSCGITMIGKDTILPPKAVVGKNCIIYPGVGEDLIPARMESGGCVLPHQQD